MLLKSQAIARDYTDVAASAYTTSGTGTATAPYTIATLTLPAGNSVATNFISRTDGKWVRILTVNYSDASDTYLDGTVNTATQIPTNTILRIRNTGSGVLYILDQDDTTIVTSVSNYKFELSTDTTAILIGSTGSSYDYIEFQWSGTTWQQLNGTNFS